jgi:hypothetical protein
MNRAVWIGLAITVIVIGSAVYYFKSYQQEPAPEPSAPAPAAPATPPPQEHYAVPEEPAPGPGEEKKPLPTLDDSDPALRQALEQAFGKQPVESFLVPDRLIRRIVATVDSLDGEPVPLRLRAVPATPGAFIADGSGEALSLSARNAVRYQALVSALQALDAQQLAALYLRWYPLFQKAYEDLGYPGRYFNDRLIRILNHLLAAPEIHGAVPLVRPSLAYKFADPALEALSSGQKALLRLGPDNEAAVKAKLREIRDAIMTRSAKS